VDGTSTIPDSGSFLVDACNAADCLQAASCTIASSASVYWNVEFPGIGDTAYANSTGCTLAGLNNYYQINYGGVWVVVEIINSVIVDFPLCIPTTTTTTTRRREDCFSYRLIASGPSVTPGDTNWSGIDCADGKQVGGTVSNLTFTDTGCIVDGSLVVGGLVSINTTISCTVFEVDSDDCCGIVETEYIPLASNNPAGLINKVVYAPNGYCYKVLSTSLLSPTLSAENAPTYGDCNTCTTSNPCPTTTTTTTSAFTTTTTTTIWSTVNLDVTTYSDGTAIIDATGYTNAQWAALTVGAWCYYNNDPATGPIYGKLYNWYAVAGIYDTASFNNPSLRRQLAPVGQRIPTFTDWSNLIQSSGGSTGAGCSLKSTGTIQAGTGLWESPNTCATNIFGWTGLPGGFRDNIGTFLGIGISGVWWASTEFGTFGAYYTGLRNNLPIAITSGSEKQNGLSVRCIILS